MVATHPSLEQLFHNEWVSLVVCEPGKSLFIIMTSCRGWQPVAVEPDQRTVRSDNVNGQVKVEAHPGGGPPARS